MHKHGFVGHEIIYRSSVIESYKVREKSKAVGTQYLCYRMSLNMEKEVFDWWQVLLSQRSLVYKEGYKTGVEVQTDIPSDFSALYIFLTMTND